MCFLKWKSSGISLLEIHVWPKTPMSLNSWEHFEMEMEIRVPIKLTLKGWGECRPVLKFIPVNLAPKWAMYIHTPLPRAAHQALLVPSTLNSFHSRLTQKTKWPISNRNSVTFSFLSINFSWQGCSIPCHQLLHPTDTPTPQSTLQIAYKVAADCENRKWTFQL